MRLDHLAGVAAATLIGGLLWAQRFPAVNNHVPEIRVVELFMSGNTLKLTVQNTSSRTITRLSAVLGKHRTDQDWSRLSGGGLLPDQTASLTISAAGLPVGGTRHKPAPPPPVELLGAVFADSNPGAVMTRKTEEPAAVVPAPVSPPSRPVTVTAEKAKPSPAPKGEESSPVTPPTVAQRQGATSRIVENPPPAPKMEEPILAAPPAAAQHQPAPSPVVVNPPPVPKMEEPTPKPEPATVTVAPPQAQPLPAPVVENPTRARVEPPAVVPALPPRASRVEESTPKPEPAAAAVAPPAALQRRPASPTAPPAAAPTEQPNPPAPPAAPARVNGQPGTREQGIADELARLINLVEPFEAELASRTPRLALHEMVAAVITEQNAAATVPATTAFDQGQRSALEAFVYGLQTIQARRELDDDTLREQVQRFLKNRRQSLAR